MDKSWWFNDDGLRDATQKQPPEVFLEISQNSQENTCARVSFLIKLQVVPESLSEWSCRPRACNFTKKETLAQGFSCEFCEISKNIFFTDYLRTTSTSNSPLWRHLLRSHAIVQSKSFVWLIYLTVFLFIEISHVPNWQKEERMILSIQRYGDFFYFLTL